jgi:uncharacterized protein YaiI (UPF0178 family)
MDYTEMMRTIYVDADACPVKEEIYRVARRYAMSVKIVANSALRVPPDTNFELVVCTGFGAADDWIAEHAGAADIVVTADIPLAARAIAKNARVVDMKGRALTDADIGATLGMRNLMEELRQSGEITGGSGPFTAKDRSRFLSKLDVLVNAVRRKSG